MSVIGWRTTPNDTTIRIDGSLEGMASIVAATPTRAAILEAAQALDDERDERRSMHPRHMTTLFTALICRRSPYVMEMEKELATYFVRHRPDLRELFRAEIRKLIEEAREAA
jgi:hypothetical protein